MSCAVPAAKQPQRAPASLEHLGLTWFIPVMGLSGLSLAWRQAAPLFGDSGLLVSQLIGAFAALWFVVLLGLTAVRLLRWPHLAHHKWMHPVRYVFIATIPVSMILLATVGVSLTGVAPHWNVLWQIGAAAQAALTVAVLVRWVRMHTARWVGVTPGLLIPVVGNVLVPLAGVALGHADWAWAQAMLGIALWPVVLVLLVLRVQRLGWWPDRLRPSVFVLIAPPSVIGVDLIVWQAGAVPAMVCWSLALTFVLWAMSQLPKCFDQPFGMGMWSLSFPLAAFASLSLRVGQAGWLPQWLGLVALVLASVVITALVRWTFWGLRSGDLLQPEPGPAPKP